MWIFTTLGFFSVVQHRSNHDMLLIRGRSLHDMTRLVSQNQSTLGVTVDDIVESPAADYCCRIFVTKNAWAKTLTTLTDNINYDNFKDEVHDTLGGKRAKLYFEVWLTMQALQSFPDTFEPVE